MNKPISKVRLVAFVLTTLILNIIITETTFGYKFTDSELIEYSQNDMVFTKPCENDDLDDSDGICGDNVNYAGAKVFTESQLKTIEANQPFYEKAASKYDIPWELIAVIHQREHGLARSNPSNGQGVYQFASDSRRASCKGGVFTPGKISDEQFQIQTNCVADAIKNSYGAGLDLDTDDGVKKMFFKYNGQAQAYIDQAKRLGFSDKEAQNGEGSPYVMNRYDAKREPSSTWGQIKTDGGSISYPANNDFGAFTMYKALTCSGNGDITDDSGDDYDPVAAEKESEKESKDEKSSTSSTGKGYAKSISDTAIKLAWGSDKNAGSAKDEFKEATKALGTWSKQVPDCGWFVKAVLATAVPDITYKPKDRIMDSFRNKLIKKDKKYTKYWEVINLKEEKTKYQAGDVVWWWNSSSSQHYFIIVKKDDGKLYRAEASRGARSHNPRWGRITGHAGSPNPSKYNKMYIFRPKGGGTNGNSSSDPCNACESGSKNINGAAACLAWSIDSKESDYTKSLGGGPTLLHRQAIEKYSRAGDWDCLETPVCSCFAAYVVRWSGYDKSFPIDNSGGESNAQVNKIKNKDLWDVFEWDKQKSSLQGGDILNCPNYSVGHSLMVIEDENGDIYLAEGSRSHGTYGHVFKYKTPCDGGTTLIARAKYAKNSSEGVSVHGDMKTSSTTGKVSKSAKSTKNLGAAAVELAWPYSDFTGKKNYKKKATDKFEKFYNTLSGRDGDSKAEGGKSCDYFAHTAVVYAGLESNKDFPWTLTKIRDYVVDSSDWEEVDMKDNRKLDEYKSGDLVLYFCSEKSKSKCDFSDGFVTGVNHVAILVEVDGKKYTAQASHATYYGVLKGTGNITGKLGPGDATFDYVRVFRHKDNDPSASSSSSEDDECDLCGNKNDDDTTDGSLKDGGVSSLAEAKKIADAYNKANLNKLSGLGHSCNGDLHKNCVNLSKWFIATYLKGMKYGFGANGGDVASEFYKANIGKFPMLKKSMVPEAYSIFGVRYGPLTSSSDGHTGVIVGIKDGKVFFVEAGWCEFAGRARQASVKDFTSHKQQTYIDVNAYISSGGT